MARHKTAVEKERSVRQRIGPYKVTYHPALTFRAPPKVEIKLPGTDYTVIITPGEEGCEIVAVDPHGIVTNIPTYEDQHDLMRQAGLTRDGWALATIFFPVIVTDEDIRQRLEARCPQPHAAENGDSRVIIGGNAKGKDAGVIIPNEPGLSPLRDFQNSTS